MRMTPRFYKSRRAAALNQIRTLQVRNLPHTLGPDGLPETVSIELTDHAGNMQTLHLTEYEQEQLVSAILVASLRRKREARVYQARQAIRQGQPVPITEEAAFHV